MTFRMIPEGTRVRLSTTNGGETDVTIYPGHYVEPYGQWFKYDTGAVFWVEADRIKSVTPIEPPHTPKVWVVEHGIHWEGTVVVAVCTSNEAAQRWVTENPDEHIDFVEITEMDLLS